MNNDLINRSALKEALNEFFDTHEIDLVNVVLFDTIITTIDNAPAVEPDTMRLALIDDIRQKQISADKAFLEGYEKGKNDRPQGEWIATRVIGTSDITLTCSNCKDAFIGKNDIDTWRSVYHYCPSCGATMGGTEE